MMSKKVISHNQSGGITGYNVNVKSGTVDTNLKGKKNDSWYWNKITKIVYLVAAIISILSYFGLKPYLGTKPQEKEMSNEEDKEINVTSYDQSGGITAQNVTTQTTIINNYFDKQSRELEQTLLAKYPLGYTLFAVDGKTIHVPESLSFEKDYVVIWTDSKISNLESDWIEFYPPEITYKPTANAVLGKFNFRLTRKIGFTIRYPWLPKQANAFIEVLDDKDSFAVLVLGFK